MTDIVMPKLSDQMEEGTIVKWLVHDGARVAAGAELVEIETDKATTVYEAAKDGTFEILVAEGATVPVGTPIGRLGEGVPSPARDATPEPALVTVAEPARPPAATHATGVVQHDAGATPVARRLAARHGVTLGDVQGSGPRGRVTKRDVLRAAGIELVAEPEPAPAAAAAEPVPEAIPGVTEVVTPSRLRQIAARRLTAQAAVPVFQVQTDVAMDAALALRAELKAVAGTEPAPSVNDLTVRACALALRGHPRVNASYQGGRFVLYQQVHVGMAVATDDGLLVATLRDADQKSLGQLARESRELAGRVREGRATAEELSGATFTVSNLGMYGMTEITAVINPPQAAILGVGTARPTLARADDGAIVDRTLLALNLSCDHRILDGADGAQFLSDVRALLETPLRLVL